MLQGMTALYLLRQVHRVAPGDGGSTVLLLFDYQLHAAARNTVGESST